jgi:hypothetical protein
VAKAKQETIDAVEELFKPIPEVTKAAEEYEKARDDWMAKSGPVKNAKKRLIQVMQAYELPAYRHDDLRVKLIPGATKVKVSRGEDDEPEDD